MIPQYRPWINREALAKKVNDYILSDGHFMEYKHTADFEKALAKFLKVKYCSVVNNGTISLALALLANGIKPGDVVLIPNITMMATQASVDLLGAKPVFIDVDPRTLCMDIGKAKQYIEENPVKAVIYVTLNGRSHGMGELSEFYKFCDAYKVGIIEDNAQSLGSRHNDNTMISAPENGIGSFSFSVQKTITTGQGGCLVTNVDYYGEKIKRLKDFGRLVGGTDKHEHFGINSKFTEIQALMGLNQMTDVDYRIYRKKLIYNTYRKFLTELIPDKIHYLETNDHVSPWFVDIYLEERDELQVYLKNKGIGTRAIYPPLSSQKLNGGANPYELINSFNHSRKGLWLPSSMDITEEEIETVCKTIKEFYNDLSIQSIWPPIDN